MKLAFRVGGLKPTVDLVLFAATAIALAGQNFTGQRPDFTGTWKQVGLPEHTRIDRIEHHDPDHKVFMDSRIRQHVRQISNGP